MMRVPFIGGAYTSRSVSVNAQTCVNLFVGIDQQSAKATDSLFGTPGLTLISTVIDGSNVQVRGMIRVNDSLLIAVVRDEVYSVSTSGTATFIGKLASKSGRVSMQSNGVEVIIVDGTSAAQLINLTTTPFSIGSVALPFISSSVTFQDGFFIAQEDGTGRFYTSAPYDGSSWDATSYATAEGRPDSLVTVISNTQDLWLFGEISTEVWYNTGNVDFPFGRITGALLDVGTIAPESVTRINGRMYWITDKKRVVRNSGYAVEYISTTDIDYILSTFSSVSDAKGFTYTQEGQEFYVLCFPTANRTFVFSVTTGFWHEWSSYDEVSETWGRHRANSILHLSDNVYVGDYFNGKIYRLDMDVYTDNGALIRRERATQTIYKDRLRVTHDRIEVEFEAGVGLTSGYGSDPQVEIDWSDDGGKMWSSKHFASIGKIGAYKNRVVVRRLGQSRNRVYRLAISDPVKICILSGYLDLREAKS